MTTKGTIAVQGNPKGSFKVMILLRTLREVAFPKGSPYFLVMVISVEVAEILTRVIEMIAN